MVFIVFNATKLHFSFYMANACLAFFDDIRS